MTARKTRPISFGNIIVWPVIPRLADGVKLHAQNPRDPVFTRNVVVMPIIKIERHEDRQYNDIQKIVAATMRNQRTSRRMALLNSRALEKLRKMHLNKA